MQLCDVKYVICDFGIMSELPTTRPPACVIMTIDCQTSLDVDADRCELPIGFGCDFESSFFSQQTRAYRGFLKSSDLY